MRIVKLYYKGQMSWLDSITEFEQTPGDGEGPGSLNAAVLGVAESQT